MKKLLILLFIAVTPFWVLAQTTIGKSKEELRKIIQSDPNFKIATGIESDTLSLQPGMQSIFFYKHDTCYRSKSILPLQYMSAVTDKLTQDSYKKIKDNIWTNAIETIQVEVVVDKINDRCTVETTAFDRSKKE